ncbi:hypothetical protein [Nocardia jiangxiensis]|uniref:hypothetical protein n=1 Tax=Nocardia jiangxiensis TaxID=282685 RepID=UPI0005937B97|nr:hypothetical protein [Nocardia jiangxiensis]
MTHQESDGEHTPSRAASSEPTGPIPDAPPADPGASTPTEHHAKTAPRTHPDPVIAGPPPQPARLARLGARWRTSMPLRIATAVVVALLISGIGFAAGTAFGGDDDSPHHPHRVTADHPFWQDHMGWFHRYSDADTDMTPHHRHLTPTALSATPTPSPAPTR